MERLKSWFRKWNQQQTQKKLWSLGVCALILLVEGREHLDRHFFEKVRVIAAKRDLAPGTKLTPHDLTITLVEKADWNKKIFFDENLLHQVLGKEIVVSLSKGKPLTKQNLEDTFWPVFSKKIPKGYRAYPLTISQMLPLEAGDRVDILGVGPNRPDSEGELIVNRLVLGMKVEGDLSQILLAVLPLEVPRLQSAEKRGELRVLLRNPKDQEDSQPPQKRAHHPAKSNGKIEVWEEI